MLKLLKRQPDWLTSHFQSAFLLFGLGILCSHACAKDSSSFPWHFGVVNNGVVLSALAHQEAEDGNTKAFTVSISYCSIDFVHMKEKRDCLAVSWEWCIRYAPLRWRVMNGEYWGLINGAAARNVWLKRIPVIDLNCFNPNNTDPAQDFLKKHPKSLDWFVEPIDDILREHLRAENLRKYGRDGVNVSIEMEGAYCDVLPVAADRALLFHLYKDRMRVWKANATQPGDFNRLWKVRWTELEEESFASAFNEPFQVFGDESTWFFMTASNKLYVSRKLEKGVRKLEPYWKDGDSPIKALITDAGSNKTFVFTEPAKDAKNGRAVYFQLADKPEPKPYTLKSVEDPKLPKSLRVVLEYAQVLVTDKQIKEPAKPK